MCARSDGFVRPDLPSRLGTDPDDPAWAAWRDADPPKGSNVTVYFFACELTELRVIINQGGVKVADFYTQDVGVNSARKYTSPGGTVEFEITRCDDQKWTAYTSTVDAPMLVGNFRISKVYGLANLLFSTRLS